MGASGINMRINYVFRFWFSGRVEKQEMGIGKETTDPLSSYDTIEIVKQAKQKHWSRNHILTRVIFKGCNAQELQYSSTLFLTLSNNYLAHTLLVPRVNLTVVRNEQIGVLLDAAAAGFKSNHQTLETFTGNAERVDDCKMSLSMNSKAPQSLLKLNQSADGNDVSLELTLA
uniref:Uncharacterized protein n=1 Tax=Fagus sylvatica TaxID=28930 RepID=A0A2N9ESD0_FAGSY